MKLTKHTVTGEGRKLVHGVAVWACLAMAAGSARAEWNEATQTYDTTDYVTLTASESGEVFSFAADTSWDPKVVPQPGYKFYVPSDKSLRRDRTTNDLTFQGDVLAVAGAMTFPSSARTIWNNLHLLNHALFNCYMGKTYFGGHAVVYAAKSNPAIVRFDIAGGSLAKSGVDFKDFTLSGAARTGFDIRGCRLGSTGTITWTGDASEFYGTLTVASDQRADTIVFRPDGVVFGGPVVLTNEVVLSPGSSGFSATSLTVTADASLCLPSDTAMTAGKLTLADGATLMPDGQSGAATFAITETLAVSGCANVSVTNSGATAMDATSRAILTLPSAKGTIDTNSFRVVASGQEIPGVPFYWLSESTVDGESRLILSSRQVVTMSGRADSDGESAVTNGTRFSDGKMPHDQADYIFTKSFRVPNENYEFKGDSLTLSKSAIMQSSFKKSFSAKKINICPLSGIVAYQGQPFVVTADEIAILPAAGQSAIIRVYQNNGIRLDAELSGAGDIWYQYRGKRMSPGYVELVKPATNLSGRVLLACQGYNVAGSTDYGCDENNYVRVKLGDARHLGGEMVAFAYDGIRIRDWSILHVTNTTTFAETTRGVFLDGEARIEVDAGQTVTFLPQTTFGGRLRKLGAGTLALGGPVRFSLDGTVGDTPLAETNRLEVVAGAVKPVAKTGYDGLALVFHAGTKIVLDANPADADVALYGLYDVTWNTPFALDGMATLPVEIMPPADGNLAEVFSLGICTVASAQANTVKDMLAVARPDRQHNVASLDIRDNGDATSTIVATFVRGGLTVIIR